MRIGLYGGTFDPVHLAHLVLAEQCREQLQLDAVWFVPAAEPPHKIGQPITSGKQRCILLEQAIAGHPQFAVSTIELDRGGTSFTFETLEALSQMRPDVTWSFLIGADSLRDFPTWRAPERIAQLARVVVVNRGGNPPPDLTDFCQQFGDRIDQVQIPSLEIAASDLRERVRTGRSIRYLVPRSVEVLIEQWGLYRESAAR